MSRILATLLVLACAAVPASAATIKLKNGKTLTCEIRRYDDASKTLHVRTQDGADAKYTLDQLDARSVYLVNASLIPKNDAKAQLRAANFARDAGLYAHAARRYGEAAKLDPTLKGAVDAEMAKLRRSAVQMCITNARAAVAKGDMAEAEKWAKTLIEKLPNEPEAAEAKAALEQYYEQNRGKKMAAAEQKASEAVKKDAEKARKRYDQMVEKTKKGLQAQNSSQAENLFRQALSDGEAVLKDIDKILAKYDDPKLDEQADGYRALVVEQMVEVHLHAASQLATQSDYRGAQKEVNQALSLDPKNQQALSMRARIEDYSSRGLGWVWG